MNAQARILKFFIVIRRVIKEYVLWLREEYGKYSVSGIENEFCKGYKKKNFI